MIGKLCILVSMVFFGLTQSLFAKTDIDKFSTYGVSTFYKGKVSKVDFTTDPSATIFKTRLKNAIKSGVNFAGKYHISSWGCGTECQQHVILNVETGRICGWIQSKDWIDFKKDSNLLIKLPNNYYIIENDFLKEVSLSNGD